MELLNIFLSPIRDCFPAQVAIVALLLLIFLDWVFGIGNAVVQQEFSSSKMRKGIGHKCSELGFVLVGVITDAMFFAGLDLGFSGPILTAVVVYLCVMEIGSLLETFALINPSLSDSPAFKLLASVNVIHDDAGKEPAHAER